jgi:small subunit ribosomal protein S1
MDQEASGEASQAPAAAPSDGAAPIEEAASPAEGAEAGEPEAASGPNRRVGTIAAVRGDDVFVEFSGGQEQGLCPRSQFEKAPRVGDHVEFFINGFDEQDQLLRLNLPGATTRADWQSLQEGMVVEALVTGLNTGGLELKVAGRRAFMPTSQVDVERIEDFNPLLQRKLRCKVTELNKRKRRVVLSRRAVVEEERDAERKKLIEQIQPGEIREGTVRRIEKFGAFVEIAPGVDGLAHISDLSWSRIGHPKEVVQVGQQVQVKVLKVREDDERISLGLKQAMPDPWNAAGSKYQEGQTVTGTVTRTTDFGAFVELEPGVEGLIHISQLSTKRVNRVTHVVKEGQEVTAMIRQIDPEKRRIGLSIRALEEPEEKPDQQKATREDFQRYVKQADEAKAGESLGALMEKFGDPNKSGPKGGIG